MTNKNGPVDFKNYTKLFKTETKTSFLVSRQVWRPRPWCRDHVPEVLSAVTVRRMNFDICRIELGTGTSGGSRVSVLHTKNLDVNSEGLIIDMTYFDNGNLTVFGPCCSSTLQLTSN